MVFVEPLLLATIPTLNERQRSARINTFSEFCNRFFLLHLTAKSFSAAMERRLTFSAGFPSWFVGSERRISRLRRA